jgi:hypothetical protein
MVWQKLFLFSLILLSFNVANAGSKAQLRLADRFLVISILTEVFGPSVAEITREDIFNKPHVFGGACDLYEQIRIEKSDNKAADPETLCPNGRGAFSAKLLGTANLLRVAHTTRVCRKLVADKKAMAFALDKIFKTESIIKPDDLKIEKAFNLFNPEKIPTSQVLNALKSVGNSVKSSHTTEWSLILYTLCIDPAWQVI